MVELKRDKIWDVAVVGKGLIGSATAKYLANAGLEVILIGPDEPKETELQDSIVFSSHYDQARVQRLRGTDATWTRLNLDSANAYSDLEAGTGISFHCKTGCLYVSTYPNDAYFKSMESNANNPSLGRMLEKEDLVNQFPDFQFPAQAKAYFEAAPAGNINPRKLIEAQLKSFENQEGFVLRETVVKRQTSNGIQHLETHAGTRIQSKLVVLAPGSFTNFFNLLPKPLVLDLKGENILLAEVSKEAAALFSSMPSLLYEIETPSFEGVYLIGPVQYPDGKFYIKMGCNLPEDKHFKDLPSIQKWFSTDQNNDFKSRLIAIVKDILPNLNFLSFHTKRCIITRTTHKKPYIGKLDENGLFVATGGNGYSAMCSDGLGKLVSELVLKGRFPDGFLEQDFEVVFE